MNHGRRFGWLLLGLFWTATLSGLSGCAVVGMAAYAGCEIVTAGQMPEECDELGQTIWNGGD